MGRASKPKDKLVTDGVWGPKTQAALDYVINTEKYTGSAASGISKISFEERAALQVYLNGCYSKWSKYWDGSIHSPKTMGKLTIDGTWGPKTSNALTNYIAYLLGIQEVFYGGPDHSGENIVQWETPSTKYLQRWINAAVFRMSMKAGKPVPYLP